jgi:hypothetical protein
MAEDLEIHRARGGLLAAGIEGDLPRLMFGMRRRARRKTHSAVGCSMVARTASRTTSRCRVLRINQ